MKILLFADMHMCPKASIINRWGNIYPARLENCIASINWVEETAKSMQCDLIVNLGDFFDKPDLSSETITACNEICWSDILHYDIVGNHDASTSSLIFNSVNRLAADRHEIITEPRLIELEECYLCFLPYVVECDRKPINEYFNCCDTKDKPIIIFSHNDISGIQMGPVISKTGFSIDEIESNCALFINGHLHNGQRITDKIINLGNLTGKDFGEDAFKYRHSVAILDTKTLAVEFIENPKAYNFYKIQIDYAEDLSLLNTLKNNAVVSVKCDSSLVPQLKSILESNQDRIIESRIIITKNNISVAADEPSELDFSVDHLARFVECCKVNIENSDILEEELSEVCK